MNKIQVSPIENAQHMMLVDSDKMSDPYASFFDR